MNKDKTFNYTDCCIFYHTFMVFTLIYVKIQAIRGTECQYLDHIILYKTTFSVATNLSILLKQ